MATQKSTKPAASKKEYKKEIAVKIETVLAELKNTLGEKEFQHRLKKAAKVLAHGLHSKNFSDAGSDTVKITSQTAAPKKIKSIKKVAAKKTGMKKAAKKTIAK